MSEESPNDMAIHSLPTAKPERDVREGAYEALSEAKSQLMLGVPFLGIMTMNCHYKFSDDIPTACATTVYKNQIFINDEFWMEALDSGTRVFILAHEVLHIFLEHIGRQMQNGYNPQLWNVATDYNINGYLQEIIDSMGSVNRYMTRPEFGLYEDEYKGKGADEIYHLLLKKMPKKSGKSLEEEAEGYGSPGDWREAKKNGKQIPIDEVQKESGSDAQIHENRQTAAASVEMSKTIMKSRGLDELGIFREIYDLITPRIPWADILNEYITETCRQSYTYARPSRRSSGNIVFPSLTGEHLRVCFGVDTSGSMSNEELCEALSELSGVITQFEAWSLTLVSCDTHAHHIGDYESEDGDDITTIDKRLVGGGGTIMNPMIRYANEEMDDPPNCCIIVTDGFVDSGEINDAIEDVPTIVLVTSRGADVDSLDIPNARVLKMEN